MSIKFACGCGKAYKVPEKFSGKRIKCKQCGDPVRVPSESDGGVVSSRTSSVSKRSVVNSQRVGQRSGRSKSRRSSASTSGKTSSKSDKSRRSARQSGAGASARGSRKSARAGSSTQRVTPVDLNEGNEIKKFQRKRDNDGEFERGEGRITYFEDGKPKKAFKINKTKDVTIGRGDGCTVSLPVASVSDEHVKVEYKLGTFIATDQQSSNGMLVNGRTVRRCSLNDGDVIQLGEAVLRIDCG